MEAFKSFVDRYTSLPPKDWEQVAKCFNQRSVAQGELVLKEGQICRHLYFLESGLLRFFINKNGTDLTKFFTVAPYFFTSQVSLNTQQPAREAIQALEPSVLWAISLEDNNKLLEIPSWSGFGRKITQEVQGFTEYILEELQTETAEERYQKLMRHRPELLRRVPLKHLASYLGIAPQSLSRIRKKLAHQART